MVQMEAVVLAVAVAIVVLKISTIFTRTYRIMDPLLKGADSVEEWTRERKTDRVSGLSSDISV